MNPDPIFLIIVPRSEFGASFVRFFYPYYMFSALFLPIFYVDFLGLLDLDPHILDPKQTGALGPKTDFVGSLDLNFTFSQPCLFIFIKY